MTLGQAYDHVAAYWHRLPSIWDMPLAWAVISTFFGVLVLGAILQETGIIAKNWK